MNMMDITSVAKWSYWSFPNYYIFFRKYLRAHKMHAYIVVVQFLCGKQINILIKIMFNTVFAAFAQAIMIVYVKRRKRVAEKMFNSVTTREYMGIFPVLILFVLVIWSEESTCIRKMLLNLNRLCKNCLFFIRTLTLQFLLLFKCSSAPCSIFKLFFHSIYLWINSDINTSIVIERVEKTTKQKKKQRKMP